MSHEYVSCELKKNTCLLLKNCQEKIEDYFKHRSV